MTAIPQPRRPRCLRHHVHLASCPDCMAEQKAARDEAQRRLDQAAR